MFDPPAVSSVRGNSSQLNENANSPIPITPGNRMGNSTSRNTCHGVAPMSRAASSQLRSKRLNNANVTSSPNGSVHVSWAPNAAVYQSASIPAWLNTSPTPRLTRIDGTIKLARLITNSAELPQNRRRNASPAATATQTVVTATIVASTAVRCSAAPRSPTACVATNCRNQCSETPRIGKVNPLSGPPNARITIVKIGPYRNTTNAPNSSVSNTRPIKAQA